VRYQKKLLISLGVGLGSVNKNTKITLVALNKVINRHTLSLAFCFSSLFLIKNEKKKKVKTV
jgi:hypothetical protein